MQRQISKKKEQSLGDQIIYDVTGMASPNTSDQLDNGELKRPQEIHKRGKTTVHVRVVFLKIGEIDTCKETFMAEAFVEAKWREPIFDAKKDSLDQSKLDFGEYWKPKIYVGNSAAEMKENVWYQVNWNLHGEGLMVERRRIKCTFIETLELWNFPFDEQDLSITLVSERPIEEVELVEEETNPSCINKFAFIDEQEWHLFNYVYTKTRILGKFYEQSGKVNHPSIDFSCKTLRRSGFFVWNTFFVLSLLCSMTFTTFAVVYTKPENRLQLTFILLLTTVAFRTNVNSSLPKISYLTLMDKYLIFTMITQCLVCVWHAIVGGALHCVDPCVPQIPPLTIFWADKIVLITFGFLYFLLIIAFFSWLYFGIVSKFKKLEKFELTYQKRLGTVHQRIEYDNKIYDS